MWEIIIIIAWNSRNKRENLCFVTLTMLHSLGLPSLSYTRSTNIFFIMLHTVLVFFARFGNELQLHSSLLSWTERALNWIYIASHYPHPSRMKVVNLTIALFFCGILLALWPSLQFALAELMIVESSDWNREWNGKRYKINSLLWNLLKTHSSSIAFNHNFFYYMMRGVHMWVLSWLTL